jgi:hypothetical protein
MNGISLHASIVHNLALIKLPLIFKLVVCYYQTQKTQEDIKKLLDVANRVKNVLFEVR